jgi:hypothetical protein
VKMMRIVPRPRNQKSAPKTRFTIYSRPLLKMLVEKQQKLLVAWFTCKLKALNFVSKTRNHCVERYATHRADD